MSLAELDIVIPVYNEGPAFAVVLDGLDSNVRTRSRVLICYDRENDTTLQVVRSYKPRNFSIELVLNRGRGAHCAIMTGFAVSDAPAVLMYPGDDVYNSTIIDEMFEKFRAGYDIVAASRFIPGGCMQNCPWLKAVLVRCSAFTLYHIARVGTHDASNGFRLFSRRVLENIHIESTQGFTYSIEFLVKAHRLGWKIGEVPARWIERKQGTSRFRVLHWLPSYLRWYTYPFATTFLRRGPETVRLLKLSPDATFADARKQTPERG